jgi:hypothetical protein
MKHSVTKTDNGLVEIPPFDFDHSQPNKFAAQYDDHVETRIITADDRPAVMLDSDVAEYFPDSESVNAALRSLITAIANIKQRPVGQRRKRKNRTSKKPMTA